MIKLSIEPTDKGLYLNQVFTTENQSLSLGNWSVTSYTNLNSKLEMETWLSAMSRYYDKQTLTHLIVILNMFHLEENQTLEKYAGNLY